MKKKKSIIIIISSIILMFSLIIFAINLKFKDYTSSEQTRIDGLEMTHILEQIKPGRLKITTELKYTSKFHSFFHQIWKGNGEIHYRAVNKSGKEILKTKSFIKKQKGIGSNFFVHRTSVNKESESKLEYYKKSSETIYFETKETSEKYEGYIEIVVENNFFSKIFIGNIVDGIFYLKREKIEIKKD